MDYIDLDIWSSRLQHLATLISASLALDFLSAGASSVDSTPVPVAMITTPSPPARIRTEDLRKIVIDAGAAVGYLRSLQGVNGAPAPGGHKPENFKFGGWNMPEHVDVSAGYRMARID